MAVFRANYLKFTEARPTLSVTKIEPSKSTFWQYMDCGDDMDTCYVCSNLSFLLMKFSIHDDLSQSDDVRESECVGFNVPLDT